MNCPRCDKVMTQVHPEGAEAQQCPQCEGHWLFERCHGVWLDGGELRAIQEMGFVAAVADAVRFITQD